MYKILIADGSPEFCQELRQELRKTCTVEVCQEGAALLSLLHGYKPDVLVIDLMLPGAEGISLLRSIVELEDRPIILVTTPLANSFVQAAMAHMGVNYLMVKPCEVPVVAQRVCELIRYHVAGAAVHAADQWDVTENLLRLGIPAKLRGSKYLQRAVVLMLEDPTQLVTKELYPAVGQEYGVDGKRVERCIRNAIHTTWKRCDERVWGEYFLSDADGHVVRPTNSEFISRLVNMTRADRQS